MAVSNNNVIEGQLADALSTIQDTWLIASQVLLQYTRSLAHRCKRMILCLTGLQIVKFAVGMDEDQLHFAEVSVIK
jgi:hypothetical protein